MSAEDDLPDSCQVDRITEDWCRAVLACRAGDVETAADAIVPRDMPDGEAFTRARGFMFLGAAACGTEIRKTDPNPFGIWGFDLIEEATGKRTDPTTSLSAADATAVARMVIASANHDWDTVNDLCAIQLAPDASAERAMVVFDLIRIYIGLSAHTKGRAS